jgi:hypothetical protein
MIEAIAPDIWHMQHKFIANGVPVSSRMTVVRLRDGSLWLHSPVPISDEGRAELASLGKVKYIVAPNKTHHLFLSDCLAAFPHARFFGASGLSAKRPDLKGMTELKPLAEPSWSEDLDQVFFDGIPFGNETVWFHKSSQTLIVTDLCQYWQGDLPLAAKLYAYFAGVRKKLAVPRTVRLLVKNRQAAQASANRILQWPFKRVIVAHNAIVENDAYVAVEEAFACFN